MKKRFISIIILFTICFLFYLVQLLNPNLLDSIDRLLLLAPCVVSGRYDNNDMDNPMIHVRDGFNLYDLSICDMIIWIWTRIGLSFIIPIASFSSWWYDVDNNETSFSYGDFSSSSSICEMYQDLRCQIRAESVGLESIFWWDKVTINNLQINSNRNCILDRNKLIQRQEKEKGNHQRQRQSTHTADTLALKSSSIIQFLSPFYLWYYDPIDMIQNSFDRHLDIPHQEEREGHTTSKFSTNSQSQTLSKRYPPVIEISYLSVNWESIIRPIININATNVTINLVIEDQDKVTLMSSSSSSSPSSSSSSSSDQQSYYNPFLGNVEISIPSVIPIIKVGNWTMNDIISMIPDPPQSEGLYPKLGIVNLTNVAFQIHDQRKKYPSYIHQQIYFDFCDPSKGEVDREEDCDTDSSMVTSTSPMQNEVIRFDIPNELFLPVLLISQKAYEKDGGIDQNDIDSVIYESISIILRNYILGGDGDESTRVVINFFESLQRESTVILDMIKVMVQNFVQEGGDVIQDQLINMGIFVQKVEQMWNDAIQDHIKNNPTMSKLSNDLKIVWDQIMDLVLLFDVTLWNDAINDHVKVHYSRFTNEFWDGLDQMRRSIVEKIEINFDNFWDHVADETEQAWQGVEDLVESGIEVTTKHFADFLNWLNVTTPPCYRKDGTVHE